MIRGLFVGVGIMLVCPLIPVAHFVLVPASPFIAGYFGINYVRGETGSPSALALQYGALLALVLLALTGVPAAVFTVWFDPPVQIPGPDLDWSGNFYPVHREHGLSGRHVFQDAAEPASRS